MSEREDIRRAYEILSLDKAELFLEKTVCLGGEDLAEDVNGGLQRLLKLDWQAKTRLVIHFADAPCHGSEYQTESFRALPSADNFPSGHQNDKKWDDLLQELLKNDINYEFQQISKDCEVMFTKLFKLFNEIRSTTEGSNNDIVFQCSQPLDLDVDLETLKKSLKSSLEKGLRAGISSAISRESFGEKRTANNTYLQIIENNVDDEDANEIKLENITDLRIEPDWKSKKFTQKTECLLHYLQAETYEKVQKCDIQVVYKRFKIEVDPTPFAQGSFSYAHAAKLTFVEDKKQIVYNMVLKNPIKKRDDSYFDLAIKKNLLAYTLAERYNQDLKKAGCKPEEKIFYSRIMYIDLQKKYFLEPFIKGTFVKYTSNDNHVNEYVPLITAFSHYTYQITENQYMVVDLQGVDNLLTDPGIHAHPIEFSNQGDFGDYGMCKFFRAHECNQYCKLLGLKEHPGQRGQKDSGMIKKEEVTFNLDGKEKCFSFYCNSKANDGAKFCTACINAKLETTDFLAF